MPTYVWRNGDLVDKHTGRPMVVADPNWKPTKPYIASDIGAYQSPVTGEWVEGRAARREDLKKHDCVEVDPPKRPRGYRNKRFAEKHGLPFEG